MDVGSEVAASAKQRARSGQGVRYSRLTDEREVACGSEASATANGANAASGRGRRAHSELMMRRQSILDGGGESWQKFLEMPENSEEIHTFWEHGELFLDGVMFQLFICVAIIANAMAIGYQTDHPNYVYGSLVEGIFMAIFTAELSVRIVILGPRRYFGLGDPDFMWNMFDFAVVVLGVIDLAAAFCSNDTGAGEGGQWETLFRFVRLLRIVRVLKLMRFLKQAYSLYMLAHGFMEAAIAVVWVTLFMVCILYVCAIIIVRALAHTEYPSEFLSERFGGVRLSMLTLFQIMSVPDLTLYYDDLQHNPVLHFFLIIFIVFGSFGVTAIINRVIVESMFEKNLLRMEEDRQQRDTKRQALGMMCVELFEEAEQTNDGEVSTFDVEAMLPQITDMFETHFVSFAKHDFEGIVELMDIEESGFVKKEDFSRVVLSLAEGVRPRPIMEIQQGILMLKEQMNRQDKEAAKESSISKSMAIEAAIERFSRKLEEVALTQRDVLRATREIAEGAGHSMGETSPGGRSCSVASKYHEPLYESYRSDGGTRRVSVFADGVAGVSDEELTASWATGGLNAFGGGGASDEARLSRQCSPPDVGEAPQSRPSQHSSRSPEAAQLGALVQQMQALLAAQQDHMRSQPAPEGAGRVPPHRPGAAGFADVAGIDGSTGGPPATLAKVKVLGGKPSPAREGVKLKEEATRMVLELRWLMEEHLSGLRGMLSQAECDSVSAEFCAG